MYVVFYFPDSLFYHASVICIFVWLSEWLPINVKMKAVGTQFNQLLLCSHFVDMSRGPERERVERGRLARHK